MFASDARRILKLTRDWQESRRSLSAYHHADVCREEENLGYNRSPYPAESTRHFEQAKEAREIVDARHAEISELENLLRDHAPKLLGLIPAEINFWNLPPADLSPWMNAMRQIEAEVLVLVDEFLRASDEPPPAEPLSELQPITPIPIKWLTGWGEILQAVGMKSNDREKVKSLNERLSGPIQKPQQGGQPIVDKAVLLEWWNKLAVLQQEKANVRDGERLSAESTYHYGQAGEVAPELNGAVKNRRGREQT